MVEQNPQERFIRIPEVSLLTGRSRSSIYRDVEEGTIPSPVKIGKRAIGWRLSSIMQWIEDTSPRV